MPETTITLNPAQLAKLLASTITARLPVMITGAPGVGKSAVIYQAARAAGADYLVCHPVVCDPTDFRGLPWPQADDGTATFLPYGDLATALSATTPLVWLLDDLGQASPAVQAACMQLILAREINGHKLPDCVTFIAATNRRQDRAGVTGILEPVKSRFAAIVELAPDVEASVAWGADNGWSAEDCAFLRFRPELLSAFEPTADMTNSPSPRTWDHCFRLMRLDLDPEIMTAAIVGAVGAGAAMERLAFAKLYGHLPAISEVLCNGADAPLVDDPGALFAVAAAIGRQADAHNFSHIAAYAGRLVDAGHGEFAAMAIKDALRNAPQLANCAAYAELAASAYSHLLTA